MPKPRSSSTITNLKRSLNTARKMNLESRILRRLKIMARPKCSRNPFAVFARLLQGGHLTEIIDLATSLVDRWNQLTPEEKARLVEEISTLTRDQTLMQARLRSLAAANINRCQRCRRDGSAEVAGASNSKASITSSKRIQIPPELCPDSAPTILDEEDVEALIHTWNYVESNIDTIAKAILLRFVKSCPRLHATILTFKSLVERVWLNESVRIHSREILLALGKMIPLLQSPIRLANSLREMRSYCRRNIPDEHYSAFKRAVLACFKYYLGTRRFSGNANRAWDKLLAIALGILKKEFEGNVNCVRDS